MRRFGLLTIGSVVLIVLGFSVSGYLFARSVALSQGGGGSSFDVCSIVFKASCDATLLSIDSTVLGLPIAGWGLVYFGFLLTLAALRYFIGEEFWKAADVAALTVASVGVGVSGVLVFLLVRGSVPFCPLCVVVQGINVLLWLSLWGQSRLRFREVAAGWRTALFFVIGSKKYEQDSNAVLAALGLSCSLVIAGAVFLWAENQTAAALLKAERALSGDAILMRYVLQSTHEIPVAPDAIRIGPADAPAEFVLFGDFQCGGCRLLSQLLEERVATFGDLVTIVYKHFPLDASCNTGVTNSIHDAACDAAVMAEAAHAQDKFGAFQDAVYALGIPLDSAALGVIASSIGILEDMEGGVERVEADIADGLLLGIDEVPALFLNGRRIHTPTGKVLDTLIWHVADFGYTGVEVSEEPVETR